MQVVPAARRLAREHGIALADVTGSGPDGRITEADVRALIEGPGRSVGTVPLAGTRSVIARRMMASLQGSRSTRWSAPPTLPTWWTGTIAARCPAA